MMDAGVAELFDHELRRACDAVPPGGSLDSPLVALGWRDALEADPPTAIRSLFELQGERCLRSAALELVMLDALDGIPAGQDALVLPPLGEDRAPGKRASARVRVDGLRLSDRASGAVVVVTEGNSALVASSDLLTTLRLEGLDSSLGWLMVGGDLGDDGLVRIAGWDEALRRARLAVASELLGLGRAMLDLARTHALERHQFGQPIARFQAVRHRLADALVALEAASSAIGAAWNDGLSLSAVMAKSVAGRSARIAAGHAQQVLAGIGFTSEHPFHLHLRRVLVLDQLFGGTGRSARSLGQLILESGKLPEFGGL